MLIKSDKKQNDWGLSTRWNDASFVANQPTVLLLQSMEIINNISKVQPC